jgi:hypothetical protein
LFGLFGVFVLLLQATTGEKMLELTKGTPSRWRSGQSGNPRGRTTGSRNKFGEQFYRDLARVWQERGPDAIERTAQLEPAKFLAICASLIPKHVSASVVAQPVEKEAGASASPAEEVR